MNLVIVSLSLLMLWLLYKRIKKGTKTKLNELINGKRAMSADFAVLIGKVLNTSPRMWMNLQTSLDIWEAEEKVGVA